jgi:lipopolysaccharide export LptBFGC system permease protein LptF
MEIERETIVEAAVAAVGVAVFIAVTVVAGSMSNGTTGLTETGALVLVAGIAVFVVVMSALGLWLSTRE